MIGNEATGRQLLHVFRRLVLVAKGVDCLHNHQADQIGHPNDKQPKADPVNHFRTDGIPHSGQKSADRHQHAKQDRQPQGSDEKVQDKALRGQVESHSDYPGPAFCGATY